MRFPTLLTSLAVLAFTVSCNSRPESGTGASGGGKHVDPATAGTLTGHVVFEGTPPAPESLKMASDPACEQPGGQTTQSDAVLINDGAVQNVFVYVKDGLDPSYSFDVPKDPLKFDQRGCRYLPHVFGVRAGQPIEIINDDPTLHNVHALSKANPEFNQMLAIQGARMTKTFSTPEVMIRFQCDIHNWMTAWAGVVAHPFFAVTSDRGTFEIAGLPPGTYTLEAWHERFGTQTQKVTIGDRHTQTVSFTFKAKT